MAATKMYHWQSLSPLDAPSGGNVFETHPNKVVQLLPSTCHTDEPPSSKKLPAPQDWSLLIDRVRHAVTHARDVEAHAQEQEQQIQDLLERAREDLRLAAEQVRAAETRTADIQSRADVLLNAADDRVKVAEERARVAEEWLSHVYDTIADEFGVETAAKRTA